MDDSSPRDTENERPGVLAWLKAPCERVSRALSDSLDRPLGRWELVTVRLHELVCPACRRFHRQLQVLRAILVRKRARDVEAAEDSRPGLPADARLRIQRALQAALQNGDALPPTISESEFPPAL